MINRRRHAIRGPATQQSSGRFISRAPLFHGTFAALNGRTG